MAEAARGDDDGPGRGGVVTGPRARDAASVEHQGVHGGSEGELDIVGAARPFEAFGDLCAAALGPMSPPHRLHPGLDQIRRREPDAEGEEPLDRGG